MSDLSWQEYVDNFDNWSESTRRSYVSRLKSFGEHQDVAWIASYLYDEAAGSKLINMAIDAGGRFDADDINLLEFSVNGATLKRMKESADNRVAKRKKKELFWSGVAQEEFAVDFMNDLFGRKK